jgi:hypothetical protein
MAQQTRLAVPVSERDHSQGPATAPIILVQYGDYECPYTRLSTTVVRAIQQQLGEQLRFVYRNFPLTEIHPHALHAALATNARSPASRGMWKGVNAAEYKALPRSSSMEPCIAVPGSVRPCFLHSRQRADHRDAREGRSCGAERRTRWSNTWRIHATHSTGKDRSAGQRCPMRPGERPARPCTCGHRSWAKSAWHSLPFSTTGGMSPCTSPRVGCPPLLFPLTGHL